MVRMSEIDPSLREHIEKIECTKHDSQPWVEGPSLSTRRVAIISTAGLIRRGDRPFALGDAGYRLIPGDLDMAEMVMSHVSTNFDRSGFQQDVNVVFPIDRLRELAATVALSHHEKWDGSGYPRGLAGEDIPLASRIVAMADVFDALRSERSYKEEFSVDKSIEIMTGLRGNHFAPDVFDQFMKKVDAFEEIRAKYMD